MPVAASSADHNDGAGSSHRRTLSKPLAVELNIAWLIQAITGGRRGVSIVTGDEQIAAEIYVHAEVLPALGQRLDLVVHGVGQRRQADDSLSVGGAGERVEKGLRERAVLPGR